MGQKLSKQTFAPAIDSGQASDNLLLALKFLGQALPPIEDQKNIKRILSWATEHWSLPAIPRLLSIAESSMP